MKTVRLVLSLCVAILSLLPSASAAPADGDASRVEQARRLRLGPDLDEQSRREPLVPWGQTPASPGDEDLGEQVILKRQVKETPVSLQVDVSGFYTDNVALTDRGRNSDTFLVAQAGVGYRKRFTETLAFDAYLREAVFRYATNGDLDFESMNVGFGLTYVARPLWETVFSIHYNYNRLTDGSEHHEFFKNQTLNLSLLKAFELSKAHYIFAGYSAVFNFSEPVALQRDEYGVFAGYRVNLTRSLSADVFYRAAYFDYVNGRGDWNQSLGLGLKWSVTKAFSVSASVSFGWNTSNREIFDYYVSSPGIGLSASFAF